MNRPTGSKGGRIKARRMTLAELLVAVGIFLIVIVATIGLSLYIMRRHQELAAANDLRSEQGAIIQYLRGDTSLSCLEEMIFHPSPAVSFLSISMPILLRDDGQAGTPPVDQQGNVAWTHTAIYHTFPNPDGGKELRRTVVSGRDNSWNRGQRYTELLSVVNAGDGSGLTRPSNTRVLCRHLDDFRIELGQSIFDTYDPTFHSRHLYMGTTVLSPGAHQITLTVAGKHDDSNGLKIGLDTLTASQNETFLEGEFLYDGAATSRGNLSLLTHEGPTWSNAREALFSPVAADDSVTYTFYNDMWQESLFAKDGASLAGSKIKRDLATGEQMVTMSGMEDIYLPRGDNGTWTVREKFDGPFLRIAVPGYLLLQEGMDTAPRFRVKFIRSFATGQTLKMRRVAVMERDSGPNAVADAAWPLSFVDASANSNIEIEVDAQGASVVSVAGITEFYSDWVDETIHADKNYLVAFEIIGHTESAQINFWRANSGPDNLFMLDNSASLSTSDPFEEPDWLELADSDNGITLTSNRGLPIVQGLFVSHPESGHYTSRIFDTRQKTPVFTHQLTKVSNVDANATNGMTIQFRSGDQPDLSDAPAWSEVAALNTGGNGFSSPGDGLNAARYVQFKTHFTTSFPHIMSQQFHSMVLRWPGVARAVDISGHFGFGPDRGQFTAAIDGNPLVLNNLTYHVKVKTDFRGKRQFARDMSLVVSPRWQ